MIDGQLVQFSGTLSPVGSDGKVTIYRDIDRRDFEGG